MQQKIDLLHQLKKIDNELPHAMNSVYEGTVIPSAPSKPAPHVHVGTKTQAVDKRTPVQPTQRNYSNEKALWEVILDVLKRRSAKHGLNASEICEAIQKDGLWKSSSPDISNMVQTQIHGLRKKQLVIRGDDRRYLLNPSPPAESIEEK
jgi:hypothetical protein